MAVRNANSEDFQVFVPRKVVASDGETGVTRHLNGRLVIRPRQVVLGAVAMTLMFVLNWLLAMLDQFGLSSIHKVMLGLAALLFALLIFMQPGGVDAWTWFVRYLRVKREAKAGLHNLKPPREAGGEGSTITITTLPAAQTKRRKTNPTVGEQRQRKPKNTASKSDEG